jgi:hypothetical protein
MCIASFVFIVSLIELFVVIFEVIVRQNDIRTLGIYRLMHLFYDISVVFIVFTHALQYGAEANIVDEKIREELMLIKGKLEVM